MFPLSPFDAPRPLTARPALFILHDVAEIKLKSAAMTPIGRSESDYLDLAVTPLSAILSETNPAHVRHFFFSTFASAELCDLPDAAHRVVAMLAERFPGFAPEVHDGHLTGGSALFAALRSAANTSDDGEIIVAACEKMTHLDAATLAGRLAPRVQNPLEVRYGATLPALAALATQAWMSEFRVPSHAIDAIAVKAHRNAKQNPLAHFQKNVTTEDVSQSPLIADPLRRHHCAPVSDGAVACLLSRTEGAVSIKGWGRAFDAKLFQNRRHPGRFPAAARAAEDAFAISGRSRGEVNIVEIHDAFAPFELMNLEEMGFAPHGASWRSLIAGDYEIGARLAVNPSGGMKARGHPIGACGLTSVAEMHLQLTGNAGKRQHKNARIGTIQSAGGVSADTYAFVMEAV